MIRRHAHLHHGEHAWIESNEPGVPDQLVGIVSHDPATETMLVRHEDGREETVNHNTPVIWLFEVGGRFLREDNPDLWPHLTNRLSELRARTPVQAVERDHAAAINRLERILLRNEALAV